MGSPPIIRTNIPNVGDRVIKHGQSSTGSNSPPCNSINNLAQKFNTNTKKDLTIDIKDDLKDDGSNWLSVLDLTREECYNHSGKCYIDDYMCSTKKSIPLPLIYKNKITIPTAGLTGCQNLAYSCDENTKDKPCEHLTIDTNGFIKSLTDGKCIKSKWVNNKWKQADDGKFRCFPKGHTFGNNIFKKADVKYSSPIKNGGLKQTLCKRTQRMVDPDIAYDIYKSNMCSPKQGTKVVTKMCSDSKYRCQHNTRKIIDGNTRYDGTQVDYNKKCCTKRDIKGLHTTVSIRQKYDNAGKPKYPASKIPKPTTINPDRK